MRNLSKIVIAVGIIILISILFDMKVSSADTVEQLSNKGAPPADQDNGNGIIQFNQVNNMTSNRNLRDGKCFISATDRTVTVTGNTRAYRKVNTIFVSLYLQRWNDSKKVWADVKSVGTYSTSNGTMVTGGKSMSVPGDYYYRVRAIHRVSHSGKIETDSSVTSSIYIKK